MIKLIPHGQHPDRPLTYCLSACPMYAAETLFDYGAFGPPSHSLDDMLSLEEIVEYQQTPEGSLRKANFAY